MKKHGYLIILLILLCSLSACTLLRSSVDTTPKVTVVPGQTIQLPRPAALGFSVTATQLLTASYTIGQKTSTYTSQVQIETTPDKIVLLALSGWGGEIFSVNYDGNAIQSSSLPMPNSAMGVQHTLADFMFTYASPTLLRAMLKNTDITVQIKPLQRVFLLHDKPIVRIVYQDKNPWRGTVTIENFALHYKIKIITV